jgi:hypothetical protein
MYIYYICSVCLKRIQVDAVARLHFHPKHVKTSQTLKNVVEHVLKALRTGEGVPAWYLPQRNDTA